MADANPVKLLLKLHELETDGDGMERIEAVQNIERNLDPSLLKRYRKLKERKDRGIAVLEDCTCSECKMIYPRTHEMLRYKNSVHTCEFCSRFLLITERSA